MSIITYSAGADVLNGNPHPARPADINSKILLSIFIYLFTRFSAR